MYDELIAERKKRAEEYHERTRTQSDWYNDKATTNKLHFQTLGISIIVLGAIVSVVPLAFKALGWPHADLLISLFGALIVIFKGIERIWLPEEKWMSYRKASEALIREQEKYIECVEPYDAYQHNQDKEPHEDYIYRRFVQRCILIKAEEQNNFWGLNEEKSKQHAKTAQSQ